MPIYEYVCEACDHSHDALQKISDAPLIECPSCGEAALKKKISSPNFRLSGSGWYETDFKKGNQRNLADKGTEKSSDKPAEKPVDKAASSKSSDVAASSGSS